MLHVMILNLFIKLQFLFRSLETRFFKVSSGQFANEHVFSGFQCFVHSIKKVKVYEIEKTSRIEQIWKT